MTSTGIFLDYLAYRRYVLSGGIPSEPVSFAWYREFRLKFQLSDF